MNEPSLEARAVSRAFGAVQAVDGVSLTVDAGQVVALLGQSGSGKSTLLRIFAGLEGLDSGEVFSAGTCVSRRHHITPPEQRGLGMVFQDYALFPHLNALGNVAFGLQALGKDKAQKVAIEWLSKVGLSDRASYYPHQLSGGEQQRVALARALAPRPQAVLMDEPFSGLDPHLRDELQRTMLSALRDAGVAALIVSHDTQEALAIADQVAIMERGKIVQTGTPAQVYVAPISLPAARALGPVWTHNALAKDGSVETPFGRFASKIDGPVIVGGRPEATQISAATNGLYTIVDNRGVGRFLTTTLQDQSGFIEARIEAKKALALGSKANITISPADLFVFAP
jgi:iron(III) transport system ATP-binding protein